MLERARRLTPRQYALLLEAAFLLAAGRLISAVLPMRWWTRLLGKLGPDDLPPAGVPELKKAAEVGWAVGAVARRSPVAMQCLPRSMANHWMMRRRGLSSRVCLGVCRDPADELAVHAWVAVGAWVIPPEDVSAFRILSEFG